MLLDRASPFNVPSKGDLIIGQCNGTQGEDRRPDKHKRFAKPWGEQGDADFDLQIGPTVDLS